MSDQTTRVQPNTTERTYSVPSDVPLLPLRDTVLFPNSFMPLAVARESSVKLIDEAISGGKLVGVFTQRDPTLEEPVRPTAHDRHPHAYPQNVQAAGRQPPAHRAGPNSQSVSIAFRDEALSRPR